ncbi:glycosyltransferase family 4 protein [Cryobacterium sp. PAMC25264]|uniref:glycosyltransferase family 4 protein n=1 Tax=Cryobacterium sp. PAMC25264 TaxID=2861288 RepID=UPI001C629E7D|nr:glycosyltransferase family 4 protein [Cryobacterium sp. PAMC25264]
MKILVINKYWRNLGGVETHTFAVAKWLADSGHEVIPFAMQESETLPTPHSAFFPSEVDFRMRSARGAIKSVERSTISGETKTKLRALLDEHKIEAAYVVHAYHQLGTVVLNILAERGIPTVLSLHDYKIACPNYRLFSERTNKICTKCLDHRSGFLWAPVVERCWSGSAIAGIALTLEATATRLRRSYLAPAVVVTTNSWQDRSAIAAGVDPARILRIPHPVELEPERETPSDADLVMIGRLVPEKGTDIIIRASALSRIPVTIVGDGRDRGALQALATELGAPVRFTGALSLDETREQLKDSAGLLVPSVWHEVSPLWSTTQLRGTSQSRAPM